MRGYMASVCARFGGHAEASEDGRLVYVFPALTVTTIDEENTPSRRAHSPRRFPRCTSGGGRYGKAAKAGQVAALGALNLFLVVLFKRVGGADFPRAEAAAGRARARHDGAARGGGLARVSDGAGSRAPGARRGRDGFAITNHSSESRAAAEAARAAVAGAEGGYRRGRRRAPRVGRSCTRPCLW